MHVPEAAMHKYCFARRRYNYVGPPWQRPAMKTIANIKPAQQCTHSELRLGVLAPDRRHAPAPLLACENISHAKRFLTKPTNSSTSRSFMSDGGYCL